MARERDDDDYDDRDDDAPPRRRRRDRDDDDYGGGGGGTPPPNYLVQSILVTLCCCLPFGIAAIVNAASVNSAWASGDYAAARRASDQAKKWSTIGAVIGIVVNIISGIAQVALMQQQGGAK